MATEYSLFRYFPRKICSIYQLFLATNTHTHTRKACQGHMMVLITCAHPFSQIIFLLLPSQSKSTHTENYILDISTLLKNFEHIVLVLKKSLDNLVKTSTNIPRLEKKNTGKVTAGKKAILKSYIWSDLLHRSCSTWGNPG